MRKSVSQNSKILLFFVAKAEVNGPPLARNIISIPVTRDLQYPAAIRSY